MPQKEPRQALTLPVRVLGPHEGSKKAIEAEAINVTSSSKDWGKSFSPMILGPVKLPSGDKARVVENAWQFSKVYPGQLDSRQQPTDQWWQWARTGWADIRGQRYPMGKDGPKPLGSWWDGKLLGYLDARRQIYAPLYREAVLANGNWNKLQDWARAQEAKGTVPTFWDYDGRERGSASLVDVATDEAKTLGHGFVLAAMLHYPGEKEWKTFLRGWDKRLAEIKRTARAAKR